MTYGTPVKQVLNTDLEEIMTNKTIAFVNCFSSNCIEFEFTDGSEVRIEAESGCTYSVWVPSSQLPKG